MTSKNKKVISRILAGVIASFGMVMLVSVIAPIAKYEAESRQKYPELITPLASGTTYQKTTGLVDYTKASNWFPEAGGDSVLGINNNQYHITIPSLGIKKAVVTIGGEDLAESLIQYPGTALPGKAGNSVIFGHSILPQYYDPSNYLSIFSTLPTIDEGEDIYVDYDGITYKFSVVDLFEVKPTDIQILDQESENSYISLVTCTPPGHPLKPKRLIVKAKLVPTNDITAFN